MNPNENVSFEGLGYRDLDELVETTVHIAAISLEVAAIVGITPEVEQLLEQVQNLAHLTQPVVQERTRRQEAGAALVQNLEP
ncbi:MAG TPA: hypothetical protein VF681_05300 [Abditibacteriaceae bacterium]